MIKRIIFKNLDDTLEIIIPAMAGTDQLKLTDDQYYDYIINKIGNGRVSKIVDFEILPTSSYFKLAWRLTGEVITFDIEKCQEMKLEYIRVERNNRLKDSDTQKLIIDDIGTDFQKKQLAKTRQHLRDIPAIVRPVILSMSEVSQLEAYAPNWEPS